MLITSLVKYLHVFINTLYVRSMKERFPLISGVGFAVLALLFAYETKTSHEVITDLEKENYNLRMNVAHWPEEASPKADTIHLPEHFAKWAPSR